MTTAVQTERPDWYDRLGSLPGRRPDAHDRRRANDAALFAISALVDGETSQAKRSAYLADSLDDSGRFRGLPAAVDSAVNEITSGGFVSRTTWDRLAAVVDDAPIQMYIAAVRTA